MINKKDNKYDITQSQPQFSENHNQARLENKEIKENKNENSLNKESKINPFEILYTDEYKYDFFQKGFQILETVIPNAQTLVKDFKISLEVQGWILEYFTDRVHFVNEMQKCNKNEAQQRFRVTFMVADQLFRIIVDPVEKYITTCIILLINSEKNISEILIMLEAFLYTKRMWSLKAMNFDYIGKIVKQRLTQKQHICNKVQIEFYSRSLDDAIERCKQDLLFGCY